jgi:predicted Zn-dependent protease
MRVLLITLLLSALLAADPVTAREGDEVDFVELAAVLARDGEYERAEAALRQADPDAEDTDRIKYWTVAGLIALNSNRPDDAIDALQRAIAAGQSEPLIHLYLAQAYFGRERWADAIDALDAASEATEGLAGTYLMRSHALWMLDRRQQAMDTLAAAQLRFPANSAFLRRQVFYLIEAGLFQEASRLGREYLQRSEGSLEDYVTIGQALRRARSFDESLRFLETARLKFPDADAPARALAQTYMEAGQPLAAAELLAGLAESQPELLPEAAELLRRAGQRARALNLNTRVIDQPKKLKQRVGILLEMRRYDQVTGLEDALFRAGLLGDEDIRYALAYAFFQAGDFSAAERHLAALTRADLFRRATELRRVMAECADARWTCV